MSIRYMIVDDEPVAHDIIRKYGELLPDLQLTHDCYDAIEAIQYLNAHTVDLIFLDLNMPKLKGFEFLKTLPNPPKIIVTTAYQEYALEGYELNVVDYLLKPFSFERFLKAINKACANTSKPPGSGAADQKTGRIFLRSNTTYIQVGVDDILFVEASGNYLKVVLREETITIRGTLTAVTELIPKDDLIQVHRSFMVAMKHVHRIEGNRLLIGHHTVPIGKFYRAQVDRLLK